MASSVGINGAMQALFGRMAPWCLGHDQGMDLRTPQELVLLPGTCLVMFLVRVDQAASVVAVAASGFMDGLRAANTLLSFSPVQREDLPLEDLLPWAGGV